RASPRSGPSAWSSSPTRRAACCCSSTTARRSRSPPNPPSACAAGSRGQDGGVARGRSFGLLARSPPSAALLSARAVCLVGDGVGNLALVVHVQRTEGTGTAVGVLLLAASLPRLLSPLAGTIADRGDRRLLLVAAEMAQGVVVGVVLVWLPSLPVLFALLLLKALLVTIAEPAGHRAVPALVGDADLVAANALLGG